MNVFCRAANCARINMHFRCPLHLSEAGRARKQSRSITVQKISADYPILIEQ